MMWQRGANRPPLEAATIFMQAERFHSACITLQRYIDEDDELLVVLSSGVGAWSGFSEKGSKWLKNHL